MLAELPEPGAAPVDPPGRIAMVGAGEFGRFCIRAYRQTADLRVIAVADPDEKALAVVHAPEARLVPDWRSAVLDTAVEVVHIATPPYRRSDVVIAALEAGKSVFCEKPLALSLAEADGMIEAARANGAALGVDYVMRHQPAYRILETLGQSGFFGQLRTISFENFAQWLPLDHWFWDRSRSGGIFVEHGVHFLDAYARIAGRASRVRGNIPRRESVEATVEYASGVIGRFYHEFAFPPEVERAHGISFFERGWIEIVGWIPTELRGSVAGSKRDVSRVLGQRRDVTIRQEEDVCVFAVDFPDRNVSYERAVVAGARDVLRRHRDPDHHMLVSTSDARASLALGLACQEAAVQRHVVEVHSS